MQWPEKPTIHQLGKHPMKHMDEQAWGPERPPMNENNHIMGRWCHFCGSVHPEDALKFLTTSGARIEFAYMKYGYPHKIYINEIPVPSGSVNKVMRPSKDGGLEEYEAGPGWAKFYTEHLMDDGFDDEALAELINSIHLRTGIRFSVFNDAGNPAMKWKHEEARKA